MNWEQTLLFLGLIKIGTSRKFFFQSLKDLEIKEIKPGCAGCTKIVGYTDGKLHVIYKAEPIPKHLNKSILPIRKVIHVTYVDGTKEVLTFTATLL